MGNCEEELLKKPVGRRLTDRLLTANQQVTDRLRKKKWLFILPSSCDPFLCKLWELGARSRKQLLPNKFEYSHYLSAEKCMDIIGRSFMLTTSGGERFNKSLDCYTNSYWHHEKCMRNSVDSSAYWCYGVKHKG